MTPQQLQSLRNLGNEAEKAADEIERMTDALRSARDYEERLWASRVDAMTAQLREVDARYMALLNSVARAELMQPRTLVMDYSRDAIDAAVAAERERCAAICDGVARQYPDGRGFAAERAANAIRSSKP